MNYLIKLTYLDDKILDISLTGEEVPKFLEKLRNNEAYWSPNNETAFWVSASQLRYTNIIQQKDDEAIKVEPKKEEPKKEKEETIKEGSK